MKAIFNVYDPFFNFAFMSFDDEISGKHVKVSYTHHQPPTNGKIGQPLFLAMFVKTDKPLNFYCVGLKEAKDWIKEIDSKIDNGQIKLP